MSEHRLKGTGVAVATPFSQGHVDHGALTRLVEHIINGGAEYLVALGTTSETATLSRKERDDVLATILSACKTRVPVWTGHYASNNTQAILEALKDSRLLGISGLMLSTPAYNKPNQEGLYQHFKEIAHATDLPIMLYNNPGRAACNLTAETTLRLAHDCPNIIATKEASGDISQICDILQGKPDRFAVLSGDDPAAVSQIALGAEGAVSVIANALPRDFSDMIRAAIAEDFAEARRLHHKIWKLHKPLYAEGNPVGLKALLEILGICSEEVRLPLVSATDQCKAALRAALPG